MDYTTLILKVVPYLLGGGLSVLALGGAIWWLVRQVRKRQQAEAKAVTKTITSEVLIEKEKQREERAKEPKAQADEIVRKARERFGKTPDV